MTVTEISYTMLVGTLIFAGVVLAFSAIALWCLATITLAMGGIVEPRWFRRLVQLSWVPFFLVIAFLLGMAFMHSPGAT